MKRFSLCVMVTMTVVVQGCGSERKNESPEASNTPALISSANLRRRTSTDPSPATPQRKRGEGEVRVSLLVLPGDALAEVDKVPVRRRNGMVELVGNVGDERRVDVSWGANTKVEKMVIIEVNGTTPRLIDAEAESKVKTGPAKTPAVFDVNE